MLNRLDGFENQADEEPHKLNFTNEDIEKINDYTKNLGVHILSSLPDPDNHCCLKCEFNFRSIQINMIIQILTSSFLISTAKTTENPEKIAYVLFERLIKNVKEDLDQRFVNPETHFRNDLH